MDEIIKEIIEIDKEASSKLKEANRMKDEVLKKQLQEENQELRQKMQERAHAHLESIRETEQKYADSKMAVIEEEKAKALATIQNVYDENHEAWETDLYNRILGR